MARSTAKKVTAGDLFPLLENPDAQPLSIRRLTVEEALEASTPFDSLIRLWMDKRAGESPPEWDDFDFADFRGWHSRLAISVFPDDTADPEIRLTGEGWADLGGPPIAGVRLGSLVPRLFERQLRVHFQAIRDTGNIGLVSGTPVTVGREFVRMRIIELPVARNGKAVGGMIHGLKIQS